MKKILSGISKLILVLMIIPIFAMSFVACTGDNKSQQDNQEITDDENKEKENKETYYDDNQNSPIRSGIYKFESNLSTVNIDSCTNMNELYEIWGTRDKNGVILKVEELNGSEFIQNITRVDNLQKFIEFNSKNEVVTYSYNNGFYDYIEKFTYIYSSVTGIFITNSYNHDYPAPFVNYIGGQVSITYKFWYTDSTTGEIVVTPLYIRANLEYVCDSFEATRSGTNSINYSYEENSEKISFVDESLADINSATEKLAEIYKIDSSENVEKDVMNKLKDYKVAISKDENIIVFYKYTNDEQYTFSYNSLVNSTFTFEGISYKLVSSIDKQEIVISTKIDNNSVFEFNIKSIKV